MEGAQRGYMSHCAGIGASSGSSLLTCAPSWSRDLPATDQEWVPDNRPKQEDQQDADSKASHDPQGHEETPARKGKHCQAQQDDQDEDHDGRRFLRLVGTLQPQDYSE